MPIDIGPKIGIQGEKEYRDSLKQIQTGIKTLGTEMKVVTSEFGAQEKSQESLTKQNDVLERTVLSLNEKLELQKKMLAASVKEYGEADEKTQKWQQVVNNTQAEINKANVAIQQNNKEINALGKEVKETGEEMDSASKKSLSFSDVLKANLLSDAIKVGVKALADGFKAVTGALFDAASAADGLNTLAKQTGLSTEELQKFEYASKLIDVSTETLTGSLSKLTKNMSTASKGTGDAYEAFKALGIEITEQDGTLRDRNEVFKEAISALAQIENETERDAKAMQIFGKSAQELNPLILGGADALEALGKEAENAGIILSQDALNNLNGLNDAVDRFKSTAAGAGSVFLSGFAGPITGAIDTLTGYITRMVQAFNADGWDGISTEFSNILSEITKSITGFLPKAVEFGTELLMNIVNGLLDSLPALFESAAEVITSLADGIADALPDLIPAVVEIIITIVDGLIDNVDKLIDSAIAIILALANGLIDSLPKLLEKAPVIIAHVVQALIENVPKLIVAAFEIIAALAEGIIENLSGLGDAIGEIIGTILNGLADAFVSFIDAGKEIVNGIWQGIKGRADWFGEQVKGFFTGIVDGAKKALGIASPSKVFADQIGRNMALGIGEGWDDTIKGVEQEMVASIPAPEMSMSDLFSGAVNGMQSAVSSIGGDLSINILLPDGTPFARYYLNDFIGVARASGTPILNPT